MLKAGLIFYALKGNQLLMLPKIISLALKTSSIKMPINIDNYDLLLIVAGPCLLHPFLYYGEMPFVIPALSKSLISSILISSKDIQAPTLKCPSLVKNLRELSSDRIVYVGAPLPSVESNPLKHISKLNENNMNQIKKNALLISGLLRSGLLFNHNVFVPDDDLLNDYHFATSSRFMREGVRVDGVSTNPDMRHANEEYGSIMLCKILRSIGFMS